MAQCITILDTGERCSNRARPGVETCATHDERPTRIRFRRVDDASESTQPPMPQLPPNDGVQPPEGPWIACPSAVGEEPSFPGLRADARNILVAPQGVIQIVIEESGGDAAPNVARLGQLLCTLGQNLSLAEHITVQAVSGRAGFLISLTPPNHELVVDLSQFYDMAMAAAALNHGMLYIGQEHLFIQYRDEHAPRGYDVADVSPPPGDALYLVDSAGTRSIASHELRVIPFADVLLRIPPLLTRDVENSETVYVLADQLLYAILARYLRRHDLSYRVARFLADDSKSLVLIEVIPRQSNVTEAPVPTFVSSYLNRFPRCAVLTEVWSAAGRRLLVGWGQHYPCPPQNMMTAFPPDSLLLVTDSMDFGNVLVAPAPAFFEGDALADVQVHALPPKRLGPLSDTVGLNLTLPVRLIRDRGPAPSTSALILNPEELSWVRRLLYRLPGEAFTNYVLCMGKERAVLIAEEIPRASLPFGLPLRRYQGTSLFIPLNSRFTPELPWALLASVFDLKETSFTFLTWDFRLDAPREAFKPLSAALVAEPGRPHLTLDLRPPVTLLELQWTLPTETEPMGEQSTPPSASSVIQRMLHGLIERPIANPSNDTLQSPEPSQQMLHDELQRQAEAYRQHEDYLSAALCFVMVGEQTKAAQCYQEAAQRLKATTR